MKKRFLNFLVTLLTVALLAFAISFLKDIFLDNAKTLMGKDLFDNFSFAFLLLMFLLEPLICVGVPQFYLANKTTKLGRFFLVTSAWTLTWLVQLVYGFYMEITVYSIGQGTSLFSFILFSATLLYL